ncbi:MAG: hypothetical protein HRU09_06505 [Oligoflexales bacterium]|nr:hypothetical protein [Oligoflexales bacterium]
MNRFYGLMLTKMLVLVLASGCGFTKFGSKGSSSGGSTTPGGGPSGTVETNDNNVGNNGDNSANNGNGNNDGNMNSDMNNDVVVPPPTIAEMELERLGIGIKSAQQVFETMVNVTGIPADEPSVALGYQDYFASLTPEERSRDLKLSPGQVTALTNLVLPFCVLAATDDTLRTRIYGTSVNFNQAPAALSAAERSALSGAWAGLLWDQGILGTIPADQTAVLSAFADQVITDVEDQAATGTPLVATTVCVGTVIAFQSIEF